MRSIFYSYFNFFRALHRTGNDSIYAALFFFSIFFCWFLFAALALALLLIGIRISSVIPNVPAAFAFGGVVVICWAYVSFGSPAQLERLKAQFSSESRQAKQRRRWFTAVYTFAANAAFAAGLYAVWIGRTV